MAINSIKKVTSSAVTLATSTNNQVATVTGTDALTGESNLTFDGSRLDVTGEVRASTGVLFGSDTAAANLLDDYEEGTWTPYWSFGGGTTGIVYGVQGGIYIKIGKFVFCSFVLDLSNKGSSTGNASLNGLPFDGGYTGTGDSTYMRIYGNSTYNLNFNSLTMHLNFMGTNTTCEMYQYGTPVTHANWNNNSALRGWIAYRIV